jgi:hypothetical protein
MSLTPQLSVQSSLSALALTVYICNFYFIVLEHTIFIISEYPFLLYACRKRTSFYKYLWNWGFEGNPIDTILKTIQPFEFGPEICPSGTPIQLLSIFISLHIAFFLGQSRSNEVGHAIFAVETRRNYNFFCTEKASDWCNSPWEMFSTKGEARIVEVLLVFLSRIPSKFETVQVV